MGLGHNAGAPFWLVSLVAALAYGLVLQFRPTGLFRTLCKTVAVGVLAVLAYLFQAPLLFVLGLAFSALGDAFLAGDPKKMLPFGLVSFLLAQVLYAAFFLEVGGLAVLSGQPFRGLAFAGALIGAAALVVYLWRDLGALKAPVAVYALAIAAMVGAAFTLPSSHGAAALGALLFMGSDAVLSVRLFRVGDRPHALFDHLVWWLYYAGQALIAVAFLT